MADFVSMVGLVEKLNKYNYQDWRSCIKSYLKEQDVWEIVDGSEISPPNVDDKKYNSWIVKASKVMHFIMTTIDKDLRVLIEDVETPKEAWDILESLCSESQIVIEKEDSKGNGNIELTSRFMTMKAMDDQHEYIELMKVDIPKDMKMKTNEFVIMDEKIKFVVIPHIIEEFMGDGHVIKYKHKSEEFVWQGDDKQGEPYIEKNDTHLEIRQIFPTKFKTQGRLIENGYFDQVKHAKFGIGANLTRPPD